MLLRLAIVEDETQDLLCLKRHIERYFTENGGADTFHLDCFDNAVSFLERYQPEYDLVLLDIQMPGLDGMAAAQRLREKDSRVLIMFVTNMAQYAVRGYDVGAVGFLLKPVSYYDFLLRMRRSINILHSRATEWLTLSGKQGMRRLCAGDILYLEVRGHTLSFHLSDEIVQATGSLSDMEEKLRPSSFLRCNSCYLVNPRAIRAVQGFDITLLNGETLQISHPRRKQFMAELNVWLGEGKNL